MAPCGSRWWSAARPRTGSGPSRSTPGPRRRVKGARGPGRPGGARPPAPPPAADLAAEFAVWPPRAAVAVDIADLYADLAAGGYGYGPAFRGLRAAWRRGDDVFAEVALPPDVVAGAGSFGIHPALMDAALHALALAPAFAGPGAPGTVRLPFAWTGVSLHAAGASMLRVRLRPQAGGRLGLIAADGAGQPAVSVDSIVLRPVAAGRLEAAASGLPEALFTVGWGPGPAGGPATGRRAVVDVGRPDLAAGLAAAAA